MLRGQRRLGGGAGVRPPRGRPDGWALTAYLSYLMQIIMSVMMGTFMMMMIPRSAVCAGRIMEVLDTESSVVPPAEPVTELTERGTLTLEGVTYAYPGADVPVLPRRGPRGPLRPDGGDHRLHRRRQDHAAQPRPRLFDVTGGASGSTASTCATSSPTCSGRGSGWSREGVSSSPARSPATSGTNSPTPPGRVGGARDRAGARLRGGAPRGTPVARRAGRHQLLRRPATTARHRPRGDRGDPEIYLFDDSFARPHHRRAPGCGPRSPR